MSETLNPMSSALKLNTNLRMISSFSTKQEIRSSHRTLEINDGSSKPNTSLTVLTWQVLFLTWCMAGLTGTWQHPSPRTSFSDKLESALDQNKSQFGSSMANENEWNFFLRMNSVGWNNHTTPSLNTSAWLYSFHGHIVHEKGDIYRGPSLCKRY
jgi:hypothetical protein